MKRIILLFVFLSIFSVSDAQKFLRYHMNNNTYNGFYTENIESIIHDYRNGVATAIVQTSIKNHDIYIDNIDSIAIEDVNLTNGNINQYRIYEFNYNEGDIRKIYVDNRASLFASHNGDFGANDTILFSSAYNDIAWLFYTDSQGRIKKFFDGNRLLFFDYDSNNDLTILDLSTSISKNYSINNANGAKMVRALSIPSFFRNLANNAGFRDFLVGVGLNSANTIASNFAQAINDVGNNPELHNQNFFVDGLSIAGDLVGIGASLLAEAPSLGWSTAGIIVSTGFLMNDLNNLFNHIWPDSEQMNRYKEYYRNKYGITVKTINPENVKSNKADLRGTLMSFNGLNGNLYFTISKLASTEIGDRIAGFPDALTSNSYMVKGSATNLKPGSNYFYMLWYECEIDGLHFTYSSDNGMDFTTPKPEATTIGTESVEEKSAAIKCSFSNVPEGAVCGVQYGNNGNSHIATTSSSDGERTVNLSGLQPSTTYTYRAFIQYDGETYYGESKSFTTESPDLTGWWTFNDAQGNDGGRTHRVEFYANGTTNAFYGVNTLNWRVSGKNITITWPSRGGSSVWWEYRGTFNDDFTVATGDAFYCFVNNVTGDYWESKSDYQFSLSR